MPVDLLAYSLLSGCRIYNKSGDMVAIDVQSHCWRRASSDNVRVIQLRVISLRRRKMQLSCAYIHNSLDSSCLEEAKEPLDR